MGRQWKWWQTLFSWAPKSLWTVNSHEIKRCLLLGRKAMTNLHSLLNSRDITLMSSLWWQSPYSQRYGFSSSHVQMWKLVCKEGWALKNLSFWIVVLEKTRVSILKEINPEYSLEGLILKLKLQYFGHLMQRANSLEKTLMMERLNANGEEGDRRWDG